MKKPLLVPIIFFLSGIVLARRTEILLSKGTLITVLIALSCLFFGLISTFKTQKLFYSFLYMLFLLLGYFRYSSSMLPGEHDISRFVNKEPQKVALFGTVTGYPEEKSSRYGNYRVFPLKVFRSIIGEAEHKVTGSIQVRLFSPRRYPRMGDRLVISGEMSSPRTKDDKHRFNYSEYLRLNGIKGILISRDKDDYLRTGVSKKPVHLAQRFLFSIRNQADGILNTYLYGEASAIARAVVLGLRSRITARIKDTFVRTGTMHILAVSGLHVGILGFAFMGFLDIIRCPRRITYFLAIPVICLFAVFTGARPSSLRAAIMGSLLFLSLILERRTDILSVLALSAFLIAFFYPGQLFQSGFILSYIAVLSIIYITPLTDMMLKIPERKYMEKRLVILKIKTLKLASISMAVWIGMLPVIAGYFKIVTPSVVLSNLLAVPVLFVLVILGFFLIFTGSFIALSPIAKIIAFCLKSLILFFIKSMDFFSQIPFSYIRVPAPGIFCIFVYYSILVGLIVLFQRSKKIYN